MAKISFKEYVIVSCGTLSPELNYLKHTGFLDAKRIFYTRPGLHDYPVELEKQLISKIKIAKKYSSKIIIIYGSLCYIDAHHPDITVRNLIEKEVKNPLIIKMKNCIDVLATREERKKISKGEKIYWLTPGWLKYRKIIFQNWDIGKVNETFPQNDKAIILDGINFFDEWTQKHPEKILEFSEWTGLTIEEHKVSLNRFKSLLIDCVIEDLEREILEMKNSLPPHSISPSALIEIEEAEDKLEEIKKIKEELNA